MRRTDQDKIIKTEFYGMCSAKERRADSPLITRREIGGVADKNSLLKVVKNVFMPVKSKIASLPKKPIERELSLCSI